MSRNKGFSSFEYHMFYVLYPFVTYLLTLPPIIILSCILMMRPENTILGTTLALIKLCIVMFGNCATSLASRSVVACRYRNDMVWTTAASILDWDRNFCRSATTKLNLPGSYPELTEGKESARHRSTSFRIPTFYILARNEVRAPLWSHPWLTVKLNCGLHRPFLILW
jgi:hypothetical protein